MTTAEHLALIETVIEKRLSGDAYESYSESQMQFRGASITDLYDLRDRLLDEADTVTNFYLAEPFGV